MEKGKYSRFNPPEIKLLHEEVITSIFHALIEGKVRPGDRLAEETISNELGVSRGPVRRALQEMNQQGIVELIPRRGATIASWSIDDFEDFYKTRLVLEGLAVQQAVSRIPPEGLSILRELSERVKEAVLAGEIEEAIDSDIKFHYQIVRFSGNNTLINIYGLMLLRMKMFLIAEKTLFPSEFGYEHAVVRHDAICSAFENRDSALARQMLEEHIHESVKSLIDRIKRSDGEDPKKTIENLIILKNFSDQTNDV